MKIKKSIQKLIKNINYTKKKNLILLSIFFLIGILVGGKILVNQQTNSANQKLYKVIEVIDGDTIVLDSGPMSSSKYSQWVRLLSINAPEEDTCYYAEAKKALQDLILNKNIRLEKDISGLDKFGRLLRYVILPNPNEDEDNILINEYLIRYGYALAEVYSPDTHYRKLLYNAQDKAQAENLGLWKECDTTKIDYKLELDIEPTNKNCIIKGNLASRENKKIYSFPNCPNYEATKIDPRKGDKYFCTEQEAIQAGFEKAENCPQDSE
ncbi:thermonuclease family protein [Patescibacteria group bacterium]